MASDYKPEIVTGRNCACAVKSRQNRRKAASNELFRHIRIDVAESIFGDRFTTGSRINALTAHAQTLLSCLKQTALNAERMSTYF